MMINENSTSTPLCLSFSLYLDIYREFTWKSKVMITFKVKIDSITKPQLHLWAWNWMTCLKYLLYLLYKKHLRPFISSIVNIWEQRVTHISTVTIPVFISPGHIQLPPRGECSACVSVIDVNNNNRCDCRGQTTLAENTHRMLHWDMLLVVWLTCDNNMQKWGWWSWLWTRVLCSQAFFSF